MSLTKLTQKDFKEEIFRKFEPISVLNLPQRINTILSSYGIYTIRDLLLNLRDSEKWHSVANQSKYDIANALTLYSNKIEASRNWVKNPNSYYKTDLNSKFRHMIDPLFDQL